MSSQPTSRAAHVVPPRRRFSTFRLLRALWRYRGRIEAHGDAYQEELATAVHTALIARVGGRVALGGYRLAMRALFTGAIVLGLMAVLLAVLLWFAVGPEWSFFALLLVIPAGLLAWWRAAWGAPLDWLSEHADETRRVQVTELPERLRALALESRNMANVPARVGDELRALAGEVESEGATAR